MTRRREVGTIKSIVLGAAFAAALAVPAQAGDNQIALSATTAFVTDYLFRGVSNTGNGPAAQPEFDLTYGMFYAGVWGSNTDFGDGIEIDYYAGLAPKWNLNSASITFDVGGYYYTYPGDTDELDYFELKTGATLAAGAWNLRITNWWSPDWFQVAGSSDAIEGQLGYTFTGKIFNFFTPTISGGAGFQGFDKTYADYTYWNAGLTLGFMEHWSVDARYWDTDLSDADCIPLSGFKSGCDARVVGTVKAVF
jgi:uncharacterized protein (TIGR02001 family)